MKYKVGDKILVKSKKEIEELITYTGEVDNIAFVYEMYEYCGKEFVIATVGSSWYMLEGLIDWWFSEGMLKPANTTILKEIYE